MTLAVAGMKMFWKIKNQQDCVAGFVFAATGVAALLLARNYAFGTLRNVGPGFFPIVVGSLLAVFGLSMVVRSIATSKVATMSFPLIPLSVIVLASVLYAFILRPLGLPLSAAILVLLSTLASRSLGPLAAIALAAGIATFVSLVFILGLGLQLPLLGSVFH